MWTTKKKIFFILYLLFAAWLPQSGRMKIAKKLRRFFAKRILDSCAKNANIEKGARFTPGITLGERSGIGVNCEVTGPVKIGNDVMMGRSEGVLS